MSASLPPPSSPRAAPTRQVLIGLTVAVLIGHWLALGGEVPFWPSRWFKKAATELGAIPNTDPAQPVETPPGSNAPLPPESALPAPVTTSTIRWITPPPPPPPPPPAPPKPKPAPVVKKAPPPEPPPEPEEPLLEPDIAFADAPAPEQDAAPVESIAMEEPQRPAEAPVPETLVTESDSMASAQPAQPPAIAHPDAGAERPAPGPTNLPPPVMPPNGTLNYAVAAKSKGFNFTASGTLTWEQDGATYRAESRVSAFLLGTYVQTSTGQVTPEGLAPERFSDQRRSSEKAAHFERATSRIRYSNNAPDAPLLPGAQDQLSVTLQLGSLLNADPKITEGYLADIPVSSAGSSEVWRFEIGPLETLNLPAGDVVARRLTRGPRRPYDKTVQLWLAPSLGFLPVRTRLTEANGDFLDQSLDELPTITLPAGNPAPAQTAVP